MVSVRVFVFNDKSTRAPEDTPEGGFVMQITWKSHGDLPGMANTQWVVSAEGGEKIVLANKIPCGSAG